MITKDLIEIISGAEAALKYFLKRILWLSQSDISPRSLPAILNALETTNQGQRKSRTDSAEACTVG